MFPKCSYCRHVKRGWIPKCKLGHALVNGECPWFEYQQVIATTRCEWKDACDD